MAKKDQKKRDIILSQDNALTTARYKFDLIEKRALYCIIRNIRANYIEQEDGQRTLFENLIIENENDYSNRAQRPSLVFINRA